MTTRPAPAPTTPDLAAESRQAIQSALLAWWDAGHADWPWRRTRDPYAIWIAEVMLQQTQLATVVPYYERWLGRFPTVQALAAASLDEVLKVWEGLGYYSRARNLHAAAVDVVERRDGRLPTTAAAWQTLKGVGPYTAGAIASIAFDEAAPILDGNVIRVLSRLVDLPDDVTRTAVRRDLWRRSAALVPATRAGDFNQSLMELGQRICVPAAPRCSDCPLRTWCRARQRGTQLERPVRPPRRRTPHYDVVAGVISGADGRLLIAQRPLDGLLGGLWEFPGGKREAGESLPQALKREIEEELGIAITVGRPLTTVKHAYTHFRITLHAYHARHIGGEVQHLGVADHAWVRPTQLADYPFPVTDRRIIAALADAAGEVK